MAILMKLTDNNLYEKYIKHRGSDFAKRNILTHFWGHSKRRDNELLWRDRRDNVFSMERQRDNVFLWETQFIFKITNF
jgi:hypothetical protein